MRTDLRRSLTALCTFLLAGCGGASTGDVSGEIKINGKPLTGATVTFYDAANKAPSGIVGDDGKYEVKKVATGTAKIAIVTPLPMTFAGPLGGAGEMPKIVTPTIPAKYHDRELSGLTLDVKSGSQIHDITLK